MIASPSDERLITKPESATHLAAGLLHTCGTSPDPAAVVQAQVEACNKHDVESFLSCYADPATVYWLDGKKSPAKGMAHLSTEFGFLGKITPAGFSVDVVIKTVTGPTIANVEHMRGLPQALHAYPTPWSSTR